VSAAPTPVSPAHMRNVAGLATPWEFYWVLERPAPLAGMAYPRASPCKTLASEGFESIGCLTETRWPESEWQLQQVTRWLPS
jgi:hypothetical protein